MTLPILNQLMEAPDDAARARFLLQLPDAMYVSCGAALRDTMRLAAFDLGHDYVATRSAVHAAVRTADGLLPDRQHATYVRLRLALVRVAKGVAT